MTQYAHAVRSQDVGTVMSLFADAGVPMDFESAIEGTADTAHA